MNNDKLLILIAAFISFVLFVFYFDYLILTSIGLSLTIFVALDFINQLGESYPIKQLILLLASVQWIVGAKISYQYGELHYKYYMYVDEATYMMLIVPSIMLFYIGLNAVKFPNLKTNIDNFIQKESNESVKLNTSANIILFIGLLGILLGKLVPIPSLAFVFYLMSLLVYVSVGYYFCVYSKRRSSIFALVLIVSFLEAISSGLFHTFLLISVFLFMLYVKNNTAFIKKALVILVSMLSINVIQVVKQDYRDIIWESQTNNKVELFLGLIEREIFANGGELNALSYSSEEEKLDDGAVKVTTRLNQGWIISKVLNHIPKNQEFLGGESIKSAIVASMVPRFLAPSKTSGIDAKRTFEKATGLRLIKGTSMGLSIVGEFYANYGLFGAWIAMFIYGLFIALVIRIITGPIGENSSLILFWFILFFFQVVKAETETIKVLNHLVKSILFFIFLRYGLRIIRIELFPTLQSLKTI